jgi:hypothetical protein
MSDSVEKKTESTPTEPTEAQDESIIDLVEEIEELGPSDPLSALEQQLLGIADETRPAGQPANGLADLGPLEFHPVDASIGAKMERFELDEPSAETDKITEPGALTSKELEPLLEEDELELIEIEDTEGEDALGRVDDVDANQQPASSAPTQEAPAPALSPFVPEPEADPATSAIDVFAANMAAGWTEFEPVAVDPAGPEAPIPNDVQLSAPIPVPPIQSPPPESPTIAEAVPTLSDEQIDAAVARVIERKLGSTLEAIVQRAIETAVSNEIQRLKTLLLENDPGDSNP